MDEPVVVVDYDEQWPDIFEQLAGPLRAAVADLDATVEHVGSTAVPGLAAKPVIDIDVVVRSPEDVEAASQSLEDIGYVPQGDLGIPGREAFRAPAAAEYGALKRRLGYLTGKADFVERTLQVAPASPRSR